MLKELIKIIQTEDKKRLFFSLGYTSTKDIEFILYRSEKSQTISDPILFATYDLKEVLSARTICQEMGIKSMKQFFKE